MWGIARHEFSMGSRSPVFWAALAVCGTLVFRECLPDGTTASLAAYRIDKWSAMILSFITLFWMASVASRDTWIHTEDILFAKPQTTEVLVLGRFLGNLGLMLAILVDEIIVGAFAHIAFAGTPPVVLAYYHAFWRGALPVFVMASVGYSFSLIFATPVAGMVAAVYYLAVLGGRDYISRIFNFSLTQNAPIFLPLAVALLAVSLIVYKRDRRTRCAPLSLSLVILAGAFLSVRSAVGIAGTSHDEPMFRNPMLEAMGSQSLQPDMRCPGFTLPNQKGRWTGLRDFPGDMFVIGLWSPEAPVSVQVLDTLKQIDEMFGNQGVRSIGICIGEEHSTARDFGSENGDRFPMLTDIGARASIDLQQSSPLAMAFGVAYLPKLVITDRQRIVRFITNSVASEAVIPQVEALVKGIPVQP